MNLRDDGWGGELAGRARLIREVTRAVRARCGARFTLGVRLSLEDFGQARGLDLDESLTVAGWLVEDGVDFLHISLWDVARMTTKRPDVHPLALVRAVVPADVAVLTAGKIWSAADAAQALAHGADVVALGRSGILDPDWPRKVRAGDGGACNGNARSVTSPSSVVANRNWPAASIWPRGKNDASVGPSWRSSAPSPAGRPR